MNNTDLRKTLKRARRDLPEDRRMAAQDAALASLHRLKVYRRAGTLAAFVGTAGELDPIPLLHTAHAEGKQCFVPVLHPFLPGRLLFAAWTPRTRMQVNRYGIPEPAASDMRIHAINRFDLVIVPLLGFTSSLQRMGMGGGYYDRTFAYLARRTSWRRETLLGLAFDLQRSEGIEPAPWDIKLDCVVSEQHVYENRFTL